jgi:UDP-N-acetylglucosamine diphosphorylase/glucosamine-1-phosphate N-acetyltransferase
MTAVYLYDDAAARRLEPFASTRPVSELRAGALLIRERWCAALQLDAPRFLAGDRHRDFDEPGAARAAEGLLPAGSIVANARCAPALPSDMAHARRSAATCSMWRSGAELAAVRLREAIDVAAFADGSITLESLHAGTGGIGDVHGHWMSDVWDFIRWLPEQLSDDVARLSAQAEHRVPLPSHVTIIGARGITLAGPATIEPHVVLDATGGPILIESGARIHAFTRLIGPCYIGRDANVLGGEIGTCSIGAVCKVRGEMSGTIMLGHANKGHDGFVGHSYLGRWVNLGAGTITSNLKNTYGSVSLWTPTGTRDSGLQFLGTMFGDHVKTGIGLRLTTGCVLGAGANVFGEMPPKVVAPFSWGGAPPYDLYDAGKFADTAARMMARRHVELTANGRRHLAAVHAARWRVEASR